jgi:hypothetical protein
MKTNILHILMNIAGIRNNFLKDLNNGKLFIVVVIMAVSWHHRAFIHYGSYNSQF